MTIDAEPQIAKLLEERKLRRNLPPYAPQTEQHIAEMLKQFFAKQVPGASISDVARMGGGASKEQFIFSLTRKGEQPVRHVLRMDPLQAITETDRLREFEVLRAFQGIVPAPTPLWIDAKPEIFPRPAMIMNFFGGVTKPSNSSVKVSGLGTLLGDPLRGQLKQQFLDILVNIHGFDWRNADLPSFTPPLADPKQAVRWCFNYWNELLDQDVIAREPVVRIATEWLRNNMPDAEELVMVHADYRTGNYLFDEKKGEITAMLDWELAYIGDFHDDVAWVLQPIFGTVVDGVFRASDLFEREEFISAYEAVTGRTINRKTLRYYEILNTWKCYIIVAALGVRTARSQHNHQDILLTFLAAAGPMFIDELCRQLKQENAQ